MLRAMGSMYSSTWFCIYCILHVKHCTYVLSRLVFFLLTSPCATLFTIPVPRLPLLSLVRVKGGDIDDMDERRGHLSDETLEAGDLCALRFSWLKMIAPSRRLPKMGCSRPTPLQIRTMSVMSCSCNVGQALNRSSKASSWTTGCDDLHSAKLMMSLSKPAFSLTSAPRYSSRLSMQKQY